MKFARLFTAVITLLVLTVMPLGAADAANEPKRGTAERKAILDSIRPAAEKDLNGKVEFVVDHLLSDGKWAFARLEPQRPGGGQITIEETIYAEDIEFMDGLTIYALVENRGGTWRLRAMVVGPTDVAYEPWPEKFNAPRSVFGWD